MIYAHLPPNFDGQPLLEPEGGQLDVPMHVAGLVVADTTAFADAQNSVVAVNLHHFSKDGMEIDGDEISQLQQIDRRRRGEIEFLRIAANGMPVNMDDAVLLKFGWFSCERASPDLGPLTVEAYRYRRVLLQQGDRWTHIFNGGVRQVDAKQLGLILFLALMKLKIIKFLKDFLLWSGILRIFSV